MLSFTSHFKKYIFCISIILLAWYSKAQNNHIEFDKLSVEDGLSQSGVISICQDKQGYLWFGTRDGLNRYNGRSFDVFKHTDDDSTSISCSLNIYSILCDSKGRLWVGTMNGLNLYQPESNSFKRFFSNDKDKQSLSNNVIRTLFEDGKGQLWIGTDNGLNRMTAHGKFERFLKTNNPKTGIIGNNIKAVNSDRNGNLWVGTGQGLTRITFKNNKVSFRSFYHIDGVPGSLFKNSISSIEKADGNNLWIGSLSGGLSFFNAQTETFVNYLHQEGNSNSICSNAVRKTLVNNDGKLWIATLKGLNIYDPQKREFKFYQHNTDFPRSLSQNSLYALFKDKTGSIWLGSYYGGINVTFKNTTPFQTYQYKTSTNSISSNVVRPLAEDRNGNIWIGTEGEGLNFFDTKTGRFTNYKSVIGDPYSLSSNLIKSISIDPQGTVWVGSHEGGLDYLPKGVGPVQHYVPLKGDKNDLHTNSVICLLHDKKGRFWAGSFEKGLFLYNGKRFRAFPIVRAKFDRLFSSIKCIYEDRTGNIWVGATNGFAILKSGQEKSQVYTDVSKTLPKALEDINVITQDSKGQIWLGTYSGGLAMYTNNMLKAKVFTVKDGLPDNNVVGILEDGSGNLWISTDKGLSKFNGKTFKNYTAEDGLPGNVFNNNSYLKASDGRFYFGGYNGLVSFYPNEIKENTFPANLVFTGLKLFNKQVEINDSTRLLRKDISLTKSITFSHDQNIFSIEFSLLSYIKAAKNSYAYKLEGFENDWRYSSDPIATFTNLPAGRYTLLVKAANNDGILTQSPLKMQIIVKPPFWKTWWAYLTYVFVSIALAFLIARYFIIKELLKKEHEVNQMKLDFFTNVSHEIRTPLTLIMGPLENLIEYTKENDFVHRQLLTINSNASRLVRLVNELLDFRKAETGKMKLKVSEIDIVNFSKEVFLSFKYMALENAIDYRFDAPDKQSYVFFDKLQLEKVLYNLLSNAFKFTPANGQIIVTILTGAEFVDIKVKDTGKGIPIENRENLFTNFYQVEDFNERNVGTGIGLALSRKITELHHGELFLESSVVAPDTESGSCFTLRIRRGMSHFKSDEVILDKSGAEDLSRYVTESLPASETSELVLKVEASDNEQPTILLVEDNFEVRRFIADSLSSIYHVIEAENGIKGLELATEVIPDLVISDVMMPGMNGLDLCTQLKSDERCSHIPVILLTARTGNIHQVNGLKTGADLYLTKPFSTSALLLQVKNLLSLAANLRKKFSQQMTLEPTNIIIDTHDQEFLNKVLKITEENLINPEFGVHELAAAIGMSTPIFYKKMKSLTDMSVNNFIKSVRLKRAAQLLQQGGLTVYQVAYEVGFNDSRYFSQEFRKQYGKLPSTYTDESSDNI